MISSLTNSYPVKLDMGKYLTLDDNHYNLKTKYRLVVVIEQQVNGPTT
jgi:hypothetical protein